MNAEIFRDSTFDWLDMLQPTGLVVGKNLLKTLGLVPERQTQLESDALGALLDPDPEHPALPAPWSFATAILNWTSRNVAGAPGGEPIPDALKIRLP